MHDADLAIIITTSYFTKPAIDSADKMDISLINRDNLKKLIIKNYHNTRAPRARVPERDPMSQETDFVSVRARNHEKLMSRREKLLKLADERKRGRAQA